MNLRSEVDHIVVAADSLDEGVAWCRETFGFEPTAGGEHPLMGTHNRVFRIASPKFPRAYFEIIAVNPAAKPPGRARWFDMDSPLLRQSIAREPRLVHFVANTNDAASAVAALAEFDIERGPLVAAERATPSGLLRWKISVRDDGARLLDGTVPTLIEWDSKHPADGLPDSGIALRSVKASHPEATRLQRAYEAIGLEHVDVATGPANLVVELDTPHGLVRLESKGV